MRTPGVLFGLLLLLAMDNLVSVRGTLLDRQQKPMAGARVIFTSMETSKATVAESDARGSFVLTGMTIGNYMVEVWNAQGVREFQTRVQLVTSSVPVVFDIHLGSYKPGRPSPDDGKMAVGRVSQVEMVRLAEENVTAIRINGLIEKYQRLLAVQDWQRAIEVLRQLIDLNPERWEYYQNLGILLDQTGLYGGATEALEKGILLAMKSLPEAADQQARRRDIGAMMMVQGNALSSLDRVEEAVALFSRAADFGPKTGMAYFHACRAQGNHGKFEAAIAFCRKAVAADPGKWEFYRQLAGLLERRNDPADAMRNYDRGIELVRKVLADKPDPLADAALGQMLTAEGHLYAHARKFDQAIPLFTEATAHAAWPALPWFNLCATYFNVNRRAEAVAACDQALKADPLMPDAWFVKATTLYAQGQSVNGKYVVPDGTVEALSKYIELEPSGQRAGQVRRMLRSLKAEAQI